MKQSMPAWAAAIAVLACTGPLRAHHSISAIDISTPIWVKGTVVLYEVVNPHVMIALEERREDGQVQRWTVEGPNLGRLARYGLGKDFLQAGDVIEVCGFAPKPNVEKSWPPPRFVHGHLLADAEWAKAVVGTLRQARQLRPSGRPSAVVGGLPECEPGGAGTLVQPVHGIVSIERALIEGARRRDQPSSGQSVRLRAPSALRCRGRSRTRER